MLTINATSLRNPINDATPPAAEAAGMGADPAGFASLLRQTQAAPQPAVAAAAAPPLAVTDTKPDRAEAAPAANDEASTEPPAPQESDPSSRARALLKGKLRPTDGAPSTQRGAKAGTPTSDAATPGAPDAARAEKHAATATPNAASAEPALDPGVMHWLTTLQRTAAADPSGTTAGTDARAAAADADRAQAAGDEAGGRARGRPAGPSAAELKADADLKDRAAQGRARLDDASSAGLFAQALTEQGLTEKAPAEPTHAVSGSKDAAALSAASLAPTPGAATEIAAPAAVVVATPVTAPDFAQELGLTLSLLARDGVQQAELHLNPADMGPVSVQIVMDGTQARVDFGADMAATRQAIEAGLPELASALRDAGFTLAGGGVSQHASGRGDGGGSNPGSDSGRRRGVGADTVTRVGTAARRIVTAGGVDLFA